MSSVTAEEKDGNSLDHPIAPGLRLWMLLAMILGVLLAMSKVLYFSLLIKNFFVVI